MGRGPLNRVHRGVRLDHLGNAPVLPRRNSRLQGLLRHPALRDGAGRRARGRRRPGARGHRRGLLGRLLAVLGGGVAGFLDELLQVHLILLVFCGAEDGQRLTRTLQALLEVRVREVAICKHVERVRGTKDVARGLEERQGLLALPQALWAARVGGEHGAGKELLGVGLAEDVACFGSFGVHLRAELDGTGSVALGELDLRDGPHRLDLQFLVGGLLSFVHRLCGSLLGGIRIALGHAGIGDSQEAFGLRGGTRRLRSRLLC
mmetsp:Transcript_39407/g.94366  ORF Transcript_39407/g.94366 Transcript_39407/m.94366 type:complete len:262 (-) Transcript_39407:1285-2070(-)